MKTVGERIRQAREHRGLSGEQLAKQVGYKTQSGISNLENRGSGHGGERLATIARTLNFSIEWFLNGPDTLDMASVPPFRTPSPATENTPLLCSENIPELNSPLHRANSLVSKISDAGLLKAIEYLELIAEKYPRNGDGAGLHLPARRAAS